MNFQDINEYMLKSREERRAHLKLDEPCVVIGGASKEFRGLLAHKLGTTMPRGLYILLCHACHNGECSNPNHLYWGSGKDNSIDQKENPNKVWKTARERVIAKHGEEEYLRIVRKAAAKGGKNSSTRLSDERIAEIRRLYAEQDQSKRGWLGKFAIILGVGHTQARRLINKYCSLS